MTTFKKTLMLVLGAGVLFVFALGSDGITCVPVEPEEPVCAEPADCADLPHIDCVGYWICDEGMCVWECGEEPPPECIAEGEMGGTMLPDSPTCCPGLQAISVSEYVPETGFCSQMMDVFLCSQCGNGICEDEWENQCNCPADCEKAGGPEGLCADTGGNWVGCGSGCGPWSCGTPMPEICPAVCISQCSCPKDKPGWDPIDGCVACNCQEWMVTYAALVKSMKQCSSADECKSIPGTSCGCTNNLVVGKYANETLLFDMADKMSAVGCGPFISTCDCPAADGFVCENNQCNWNYL